MADETPLQNLLVITTQLENAHLSVNLFPKRDPEDVWKKMAEPGHYTHLYSLNGASALPPNHQLAPGYHLVRLHTRRPYLLEEGLETQLRTRWLGKAPDTIDDDIKELNTLMQRIKRASATQFPIKPPGES